MSPLKIGSRDVKAVKIGSRDIVRIMHGTREIWAAGGAPAPPFGVAATSSAGHDPVGSDHTVPLPAGEGGLLVVIAKGAGGTQLRWSTPAGWTKAASEGEGFTNWPVAVFTRVVDGTEPANLTFSTTNSLGTAPAVAGSALVAYRVAGAHGAVEAAFAGSTNPPALTPSWGAAENLWIAAFTSRRSDGTFTAPPANYGDLTPVRSPTVSETNTHAQAATAHRIHATATEDPGPFAFTGSTNGLYAATIAVRPGVTPPPGDPSPPLEPQNLGGVGSVDPTLVTDPPTGPVTTGDLYVDGVNGSDANTGTSLGGALATLEAALAKVTDGQRIIVREAVYQPTTQLNRSTAWSTGVEVFAYGDERPTIDGGLLTGDARVLYFQSGSRREHWKGFEVKNGPHRGVQVEGQHVTVEDTWVHHCGREAFYATNTGAGASDVLFLDCRGWACGDGVTTGTNAPDVFVATANSGLLIERVRFVRCAAGNGADDGIDLFRCKDGEVASCAVVGSGWYHNGVRAGDGGGVKAGGATGAGNNLIRHNIAARCAATGINHNSATLANDYLNNTSVGNAQGFICDTNAGNDVRNNLAWDNSNYDNSAGPQTESHNSWNLSLGDPLFADESEGDYSLGSGSPAIAAGEGGVNLGASATALELARWLLARPDVYAP